MVKRIGSGVGATKLVDAILRVKGFSFGEGVGFASEAISRSRELSIPHTSSMEKVQADKIIRQQEQSIHEFADFLNKIKSLQKKLPPPSKGETREEYVARIGVRKSATESLENFNKRAGQIMKAAQEVEKIKQLITISYLPVDKLIQDASKDPLPASYSQSRHDVLKLANIKLTTFRKSVGIAIDKLNKFSSDRREIFSKTSELSTYREKALGRTKSSKAKALERVDDGSSSLSDLEELFEDLSPDEASKLETVLPTSKTTPLPKSPTPGVPEDGATSPETGTPEVEATTPEVEATAIDIPSPSEDTPPISPESSVDTVPRYVSQSAPAKLGRPNIDKVIEDFVSTLPTSPSPFIEPAGVHDVIPALSKIPDMIASTTLKVRGIEREIAKNNDRIKAVVVGSAKREKDQQEEDLSLKTKEIELLVDKISDIEAHTKKPGISEIREILKNIKRLYSASSGDIGIVSKGRLDVELREKKYRLKEIFTSLKTNDSRALDFKLFIQAVKEHSSDGDDLSVFERLANNDFSTLDEGSIMDLLNFNEFLEIKVKSYEEKKEQLLKEKESITQSIQDADDFISAAIENLTNITEHPLFGKILGDSGIDEFANIARDTEQMRIDIKQHESSLLESVDSVKAQLAEAKRRASEASEELIVRLEHFQDKVELISAQLEKYPGSLILQDKLQEAQDNVTSIRTLIERYSRIQELKEPSVSMSGSILPVQQSRKSTPLAQIPGPSAPPNPEETVRARPSTKG